MITMNTFNFYISKTSLNTQYARPTQPVSRAGRLETQVSLLTLMVGNLLEKSLALAAILTATWRATAL